MDFIQQLEQMQAMLRDITPIVWTYYKNLLDQGFTEKQAFELTRDCQRDILRGGD